MKTLHSRPPLENADEAFACGQSAGAVFLAENDRPTELASVELDLAETYAELNLAPEAARIAARVAQAAAKLNLRVVRARALLCHGRAWLQLGRAAEARELLSEARALFAAEGNSIGAALATLVEAQLLLVEGDYSAAETAAEDAEAPFALAGAWGRLLLARWVRADATRAQGHRRAAGALLRRTLAEAEQHSVVQVEYRCHTSLGLLAAGEGELKVAENAFQRAAELIENLRAPLPAEEFRIAFFADTLQPYAELVRLALRRTDGGRGPDALGYVERGRSRTLLDIIDSTVDVRWQPRDALESDLERETAIVDIDRQVQQRNGSSPDRLEPLDVAELQHALGADTVLVEYFSLDGALMAFVVTDRGVEVAQNLAGTARVDAAVEQLRFQIEALRHAPPQLGGYMDQVVVRARGHLARLYDLLLRPIRPLLGDGRRLVVVPHRSLHYVPFHALYDGTQYVVEQREVSYAPSGALLQHCLNQRQQPLRRALLLGTAGAQTPRVREEIAAIAPLFSEPLILLDAAATLSAVRDGVATADVLHIACHAQLRPDNPSFSSLQLGDGRLTMRDAHNLDLKCEILALSACETGRSTVAPGDELIGLAHGFLSRGVLSMLVSQWTVDDASTATLMARFYTRLCAGDRPAAALRSAQRELLQQHPHPFYWAPFMVLGRW